MPPQWLEKFRKAQQAKRASEQKGMNEEDFAEDDAVHVAHAKEDLLAQLTESKGKIMLVPSRRDDSDREDEEGTLVCESLKASEDIADAKRRKRAREAGDTLTAFAAEGSKNTILRSGECIAGVSSAGNHQTRDISEHFAVGETVSGPAIQPEYTDAASVPAPIAKHMARVTRTLNTSQANMCQARSERLNKRLEAIGERRAAAAASAQQICSSNEVSAPLSDEFVLFDAVPQVTANAANTP